MHQKRNNKDVVKLAVDVQFAVSPRANQASGSSGTVSAVISNVSAGYHVITAYLNNITIDNVIGYANLESDSEECYNESAAVGLSLRCLFVWENNILNHVVEIIIPQFKSYYQSIVWQVDDYIHHSKLHVTDCGNVSLSGVAQDVPANKGYLSSHIFSCITPDYQEASQIAVCQADATWNLTEFCAIPTNIAPKNDIGIDVKFAVSSPANQATGSSGTVSAIISNVSAGYHVITAYLNSITIDNVIGYADLESGSEECYNESAATGLSLRCSFGKVNTILQHVVEVVITQFQSYYQSIVWQIDHKIHHSKLHVTDCGNVSLPGVAQDVPANKRYLSTHIFSCTSPEYEGNSKSAICEADATWNLPELCTLLPALASPKNALFSKVHLYPSIFITPDSEPYTSEIAEVNSGSSKLFVGVIVGIFIAVVFLLCLLLFFRTNFIKQRICRGKQGGNNQVEPGEEAVNKTLFNESTSNSSKTMVMQDGHIPGQKCCCV